MLGRIDCAAPRDVSRQVLVLTNQYRHSSRVVALMIVMLAMNVSAARSSGPRKACRG
jgi:hypothetical protein